MEIDLSKGMAAKVEVETTVSQGGSTESFVFSQMGKVVYRNGSYYIRYQEAYDEIEIPVTFKLEAAGGVTLIRRGETTTRMRFEQGERFETSYQTPQGLIIMETATRQLQVSFRQEPFSGELQLEYDLYLGQEKLGEHKLRLLFTI
ncbi:Uncharacterized beta-barrel protein YwiB, DUF1934 family [Carnobacterium iners]|uniref:Uncharacterized beta-barrel protein YwiB, DUF1934 family n=1 Tax=Carnobacterium iners TaxID=1073423 RepID=A0A1X7MR85_9LACT|nr:DUF1934 domain-containing protein [Carnobacterium iners]SEL11972.1 Uncharacterized beta-barrel protein YwiB, DUF1934 family [Carnobacterium iners]SMH27134.1 Uncharacterized beta-barrel protein YwiB, DUF1934 family [Carnobacterium iners]